jgi:hypothetical protein
LLIEYSVGLPAATSKGNSLPKHSFVCYTPSLCS